MKFRVYFFDPELNSFDNLVYQAESQDEALELFWEETNLKHRSVDTVEEK